MSKRNRHEGKKTQTGIFSDIKQSIFDQSVRIDPSRAQLFSGEDKHSLESIRDSFATSMQPVADKKPVETQAEQQQVDKSAETAVIMKQFEAFYVEQMQLMASVCTGLWRAQQSLEQNAGERPIRASRHLEAVMDTIDHAGYKIVNHTQEEYLSGMEISVLTFETREGITKPLITETIKPSIYYHPAGGEQRRIQMGEVIVAIPQTVEDKS
jgi:hypothetical protein